MKSILTTPFRPITRSKTSHRSSQAVIYGDMIKQSGEDIVVNYDAKYDPNDFDKMYVYHGNDWSGTLNIFGGIENYPAGKLQQFCSFKGEVISLGIPFPKYHELIPAKGNFSVDIDLDNLKRMYDTSEVVIHPHKTDNLILGDSHCICMYRPGWMVHSIPFKTLYRAAENNMQFSDVPSAKNMEFYFGNIDIRHHLCRQMYPEQAARHLAYSYVKSVRGFGADKASIYEPLPIENISRKIPKTGWYKGTPYSGSWETRNKVRMAFITALEEYCESDITLVKWTNGLLNKKGELGFEYMEKPQSVHLSREFYPYWTGEESTLTNFFNA